MVEENFKNLYPVLNAIAREGHGDTIKFSITDEMAEEAGKVLAILDEWEPPVLPFGNVTEEDIEKARKSLEERYDIPLIVSSEYGTDEDCKQRVDSDPDYFLGIAEEDVRNIAYGAFDEDLNILFNALSSAFSGQVVVIGYIERWDGRQLVHRIVDSITDIRQLNNGDDFAIFIKDGNLKVETGHHDGTNSYTVYKFVKDMGHYFFARDDGTLNRYGRKCLASLVPDIAAELGLCLEKKGGNDDDTTNGSL